MLSSQEEEDEQEESIIRIGQQSPLHVLITDGPKDIPSNSTQAIIPPSANKVDYLKNFQYFSILYSIVHASLEGVLVYSAAELGTSLGAYGGFTLFMTYTLSALFFAKLVLQYVEVKSCILLGLMALIVYVLAFFIAIVLPRYAWMIFLTGAAIGGLGAGILWTAQGSYYSMNAQEYASVLISQQEEEEERQNATFVDQSEHIPISKKAKTKKDEVLSPRRRLSNNHPHQFLFKDQSFLSNDDFFSTSSHANQASELLTNKSQNSIVSTASKSSRHATTSLSIQQKVILRFAAIFASCYLGLETLFKLLATFVFYLQSQGLQFTSWKSIIFCLYTILAIIALVGFQGLVLRLHDSHASSMNGYTGLATGDYLRGGGADLEGLALPSSPKPRNSRHQQQKQRDRSIVHRFVAYFRALRQRGNVTSIPSTTNPHNLQSPLEEEGRENKTFLFCLHWKASEDNVVADNEWYHHLLAVGQGLFFMPKLQLLIPYQFCFGLSAGFVDTYINGVIVKNFIGDGYIGILTAIITLTAAAIASPCAYLCENFVQGRTIVIIIGILCFGSTASFLLFFSEKELASWTVVISFYILQGLGRGIWENTNKALIAEYFSSTESKEVAFASVYFTSGIAGALGFLFCQLMSKTFIGVTNITMSGIAIVCFLYAQSMHQEEEDQARLLDSVHGLTAARGDAFDDHEEEDEDESLSPASNDEVVFRFR